MRVLLSDLSDPKSLANVIGDKRWKSAAETLQLATRGASPGCASAAVQTSLADGLRRAQWNENLENEQPGLGDAVLFKDRATAVDNNIYAVLGDPIIRRVVTGALGLPDTLAIQSVETQARAVAARLDIRKLENPKEAAPGRALPAQPRRGECRGQYGQPPGALWLPLGRLQRLERRGR